MARSRVLTRLLAAFAVAVAALAAVLVAAEPARAADVKVELRVPNSFTIGGWGRSVSVELSEEGDGPISVQARFLIDLNGLTPDAVKVTRNGQPLEIFGDGPVRARDRSSIDLGDGNRRSFNYQLSFGQNAPQGRARITYEVIHNGQVIGSDHRESDVRAGRGGIFNPRPGQTQPQQTTPPNTDPGVIRTFDGGSSFAIAPINQAGADDADASGVPTSFYWMGAVLLAVGGGILWLLFRRQGEPDVAFVSTTGNTAEYPLVQTMPPGGGPLPRRAMQQPTTVLPTVRTSQPVPPPADPWAGQHGQRPPDRTRGFDPYDGMP